MEQIAYEFAREYERSDPEEWTVEHIVTPRPSCIGLPREGIPPAPEIEVEMPAPVEYQPGHVHKRYWRVYMNYDGRWYGVYRHNDKKYCTPLRDTPHEAAVAYNAEIRRLGLPSRRLIDLGADMEQAS